MCGIFAYIGEEKRAANIVLNGLKKLEYRGYDSWGIAVKPLKGNTFKIKKKVGKIGEATVNDLPKSQFGFGHTRWATHGGVTKKNAHPHSECTKSIVIVHNGIIENYERIKKKLLKKGHIFISETDTEVAAHLIEELAKTVSFSEAVRNAFMKFEGLNAIIATDTISDNFVAVRSGSPLVIGYGNGENFIASDASALLTHTKKVYYLEDNDLVITSKTHNEIRSVSSGKRKTIKTQQLTWNLKQAEKGRYDHFMIKEIYEQPSVLVDFASRISSNAKKPVIQIDDTSNNYMIGCGTASYACIAGSYLFSKIAKSQINWAVASEFGYQLDFLTPKSLVIVLSQSGETIDVIDAVNKAKQKGAKILALVNVFGSSLYREADIKLLLGVGPEQAVASTKAFTGMLSQLILLAYSLVGKQKTAQSILLQAAKSTKQVLSQSSVYRIKKLASVLKKREHIYCIGRGLSYPASLEAALKIKEISYIHAEGFAAGELKHGVIALVEKGTPCIVFLPKDETYGANLAGAMEMKARGSYVIGVSHKPHELFDFYIPVLDAGAATIIPNVIVAQTLAYYLTLTLGLDPDMPRNLAKSVTVK